MVAQDAIQATGTNQSVPGTARRIALAAFAILACFGAEASVAAPPGGSLAFNGATSYGTIASGSYLAGATVSNFTIEFWLKAGRVDAWQGLFSKTEYRKEWLIQLSATGVECQLFFPTPLPQRRHVQESVERKIYNKHLFICQWIGRRLCALKQAKLAW